MEKQTSNFAIIKSKIIKTDELLGNYLEKSNKLTKSQKTLKEIKGKYDLLSAETDRLRLENEHLSFSFNNIKSKYDELVGVEQEQKIQLSELQETFNAQTIEAQLKYQDLEQQYKSNPVRTQSPKRGRKPKKENVKAEDLSKLQEKYNVQVSLLEKNEKQNAQLQTKIKQMTDEFEQQKNNHNAVINHYKTDKSKLNAEIVLLKNKIKHFEQTLKHQESSMLVQKQKDLEIQELRKKLAIFKLQNEHLEKLKKENGILKDNFKNLAAKNAKADIGIQTEAKKTISAGTITEDIQEILEFENESLSKIFDEMVVPSALSPMSFNMDDNEIRDEIVGIKNIPDLSIFDKALPLIQENIPKIIITPPTPNEESLNKHFSAFSNVIEKFTACISTQTGVALRDIQIQTNLSPTIQEKSSFSTQTENKTYCDNQTQTQEDPFEKRRQMKLSRRICQNSILKKRKLKNNCVCSKNDSTNIILKAIKILSDNNISVTISNNNLVVPTFQQKNFINSLNVNVRNEKMTCSGDSCEMSNYNMVLDDKDNLLGFINIKKEERPTPPASRLNRVIENPINNKGKKRSERKKRKRNISSEFNSETDTEIERCFQRKKMNKPHVVDKKKYHLKSDSDSDISSMKMSEPEYEKNTQNVSDIKILPFKKSSSRKISFNSISSIEKKSPNEKNRKYSTENITSIENLPEKNSKVLPNSILMSPQKTSTPRRSLRKNCRRFSSQSSFCKMTPNPVLVTPLSETSNNTPPKENLENDFNSPMLMSPVDDPEKMLYEENVPDVEKEEFMMPQVPSKCSDLRTKPSLPIDYQTSQSNLEIDKLSDPPDVPVKAVDNPPDLPLPQIEEEQKPQPEVKRKRGRPRKVTKLMSKAIKLAKTKSSVYKDVTNCDLLSNEDDVIKNSEEAVEEKKEIAPNKKIKIVQNIVIPPAHRVSIKKCDNSNLVDANATSDSNNVCLSSQQESEVKKIAIPPKRMQNTKKKVIAERFIQHTVSDLTSQIIEEMTKTRMSSIVPSNSNNSGASDVILKQPLKMNVKIEEEEKVQEDLECPASPEANEVVVDSVPKLIPTVNVTKRKMMAQSMVTTLFDKLIIYSSEEQVLDEIVSKFLNEDVSYVASLILDKISADIHDKAEHKYPLAPVLTDTQRVMLGFMACLERKNMPAIFDSFLSQAQGLLFDKCVLPHYGLEAVEPITRLYTAVCKHKKNLNRMRRFCCEAFYFMGDFAVPVFFHVLTMWPEVLPMAVDAGRFPLAKVLVQISFLKDCNTPGYNLLPLRNLLHKYFGYPNERRDSSEVFNEVLTEYYKNPSSRLNILSILVYCKNQPTKWVYQKIKENFIPLVYKIPEENVNLRATVLILMTNLCRAFNCVTDEAPLKEMQRWYQSLEEDTSDVIMKNAVYYAVANLPKKTKNIKAKPKNEKCQKDMS